MPVFTAHLPKGRFSSEHKRALADALNHALVDALRIPPEDRFVILNEHGSDELFLHPTFMGMNRDPQSAIIVKVLIGAHRPLEDKQKVAAAINAGASAALAISPDDIFIALIPVPNENFSFGRGALQLADSTPLW